MIHTTQSYLVVDGVVSVDIIIRIKYRQQNNEYKENRYDSNYTRQNR